MQQEYEQKWHGTCALKSTQLFPTERGRKIKEEQESIEAEKEKKLEKSLL